MFMSRVSRTLGLVSVVIVGTVGALSAQAARSAQPPASSPMDELLTEVRALRAELNQVASASIRTQLLVARLQLQEQRINTIVQQLTTTRAQLAEAERTQSVFGPQLKLLGLDETARGRPVDPDEQKAMGPLLAMFEEAQKREQELRGQETSLAALLAEEQSRWVEFNNRIDALERELLERVRGERRPLR